jgi:phage-related protein
MLLKVIRQGAWILLAACTERGECPLMDSLEALEGPLARDGRRMLNLLSRVSTDGPPRKVEVSHDIGDGIWEFIQGRLRVFYFYDRDRLIICSHGLIKKTGKTPAADIGRARECRRRYFDERRKGLNRWSPEA